MEGSKEILVRMREEEYTSLPHQTRQSFLSETVLIPDEHKKLYEKDETYRKLYNEYRKAKKLMEEHRFKCRYANNRSDTK